MKYLIYLLLIVFPVGQLGRLSIAGNEVVLHLNDLIIGFVVIFGLFKYKSKLVPMVRNHPLTKPLSFFLLAIVISLAVNFGRFSLREMVVSSLYPLRFFGYAGLFYVLSCISMSEKKVLKRWLLIAIVIIALFGLLQYIFVPNVSVLSALNWDDHYYRLVGSFLDPGFTGAILGLGLLFVFLERGVASKKMLLLRLGFIYSALALTYSRASYLLYLVAFACISFYQKSFKIFIIAVLVLVLTLFVLPTSTGEGTNLQRENSITARIRNWQESIQIWETSPIFGVGFDTYRYVRNAGSESHAGAGADSSVLLVLATTGLFGFLSYLYLLKSMWVTGKNSLLFRASFLGIIVHSFFNNTLFYPWVMEWLWLLLVLIPDKKEVSQS